MKKKIIVTCMLFCCLFIGLGFGLKGNAGTYVSGKVYNEHADTFSDVSFHVNDTFVDYSKSYYIFTENDGNYTPVLESNRSAFTTTYDLDREVTCVDLTLSSEFWENVIYSGELFLRVSILDTVDLSFLNPQLTTTTGQTVAVEAYGDYLNSDEWNFYIPLTFKSFKANEVNLEFDFNSQYCFYLQNVLFSFVSFSFNKEFVDPFVLYSSGNYYSVGGTLYDTILESREQIKDLQNQLNNAVAEKANLQALLNEEKENKEQLQSSIDSLQNQLNNAVAEKANLQTLLDSEHSNKESLETQISTLNTQISALNDELDSINLEKKQSEEKITALEKQIKKLEADFEEKEKGKEKSFFEENKIAIIASSVSALILAAAIVAIVVYLKKKND